MILSTQGPGTVPGPQGRHDSPETLETKARAPNPPVVLTFLAPAEHCNQRCPKCLIDAGGEPVRSFDLSPDDYALLLEQLVEAQVPILVVSFQGFEVTLPRSWPYVEAVFEIAKRYGIRRSFITNGMLLSRHTESIHELDPARISVSLDGTSPEVNDPIRGIDGAFHATVHSLKRFLRAAPRFADAMSIVSTVYSEENVRSLMRMPALISSLGIPRWATGFELGLRDGVERPVQSTTTLRRWLVQLAKAADDHGITFHTNDEFGLFSDGDEGGPAPVRAKHLFDPEFILRVEPTGDVRIGHELLQEWNPAQSRRWTPSGPSIVDVMEYHKRVGRLTSDSEWSVCPR